MSTPLSTRRHSLSHIMAQAVRMVMGANCKLAIGPDVDNGWYYDIDFGDVTLEESKLKEIEKKMRGIIREGQEFKQFSLSLIDAKIFTKALGEDYKFEMIEDLETKGETMISFYANIGKFQNPAYKDFEFLKLSTFNFQLSTFIDMCSGPHVQFTNEIPEDSFQLDKIAGAYWRGDAKNKQLTRVYGLAFETKAELDAYVTMREEAKKRDHRLLGKDMEIFTISDEVGTGLPLYLPRGAKLRQTLERYMLQEAEKAGYQYVYTPNIAKSDLFARSGHLDHYRDGMFAPINMVNLNGEGEVDGKVEQFYLKPMNCPMHHMIYLNKPRSYRELPYRLMEYGTVYRYEESGVLSGLIRVRGFTQNDAHVYCARSQLFEVISEALARFIRAYEVLGIRDYKIRFSLPDFENNKEKYGEETPEWRDAIGAMRDVLNQLGVDYYEAPNEAAFYGPKIDIQVKNVNGKEDSLSTIQVDYSIAPKFGITYTDNEGKEQVPAIIHMALMGSIDRFMAFLIEMNAGRFPFWVAPEQIRILTVNDAVMPYVEEIKSILDDTYLMKPYKFNEIRYEVDARGESLGKKIRGGEMDKIPMLIIVGEKDMESRIVSLRTHEGETKVPLSELGSWIEQFGNIG